MNYAPVLLAMFGILLASCGTRPGLPTAETRYVASPNHNERRPNFIILHDTSNDNIERPLKTLTDPAREVSAHYLIARDGTLYQLVDENRRAWHAGQSWWGSLTDMNSASIGIELDNTGDEPYAGAQLDRLVGLLKTLQARHRIPTDNILGHADVAPRRKVDPGRHFPWEHLAKEGLGLWCRQDPSLYPAPQDSLLALQGIGYDVSDPDAAVRAFRRHFFSSDAEGPATETERRWMQCLVEQKRQTAAENSP